MALASLVRRFSGSALVALAAGLAPAAAVAAPTAGMHVLELSADFDYRAHAQALTSLLRLRLSDGGYALASENLSLVQAAPARVCDLKGFDPSVLRENADRAIDARCQRAIAARLGAKRVVWGYLYTAQDGKLWAKAHLWQENGTERVKAVPFDPNARERAADRLYLHLVHPDEAADVSVTAPSSAGDGDLFVDEKSQGPFRPGVELTVKAGEHSFEVRREGKAVAQAKMAVAAGKTTEVQLAAVFMPRTDLDPTEGFRDPPPIVITPHGTWKRPAGFVGLGLGVALIGAGVFASTRVKSLDDTFASPPLVAYRSGLSGDACDSASSGVSSPQTGAASAERADRLCSGISTFRVLQYVFYGAGALAAGAGAYLLATAPSSHPTPAGAIAPRRTGASWSMLPWVGPTSGGLQLGASFLVLTEGRQCEGYSATKLSRRS